MNMWKFKIDKQKHFIAGFVVAFTLCFINVWLSIVIVISIALGKEIKDEIVYGGFSLPDLVYTIIGGVIGIILQMILTQ